MSDNCRKSKSAMETKIPNKRNMLEIANSAVVIRSQTHDAPALSRQDNLYVSNLYGPEGWAESVALWLKNF
mgnify:CR=1 FL=1